MSVLFQNQVSNNRLQKLNHTHEFMVMWLIRNPGSRLSELAETIGYARAWVYNVVHSDLFQALYRERQAEFGAEVLADATTMIKAGAVEAVEAIRGKLERNPSEKFIIDAAKTLLPAAGYSAPAVNKLEPQHHLHLHADAATLESIRARRAERFAVVPQSPAAPKGESESVNSSREDSPSQESFQFEDVA